MGKRVSVRNTATLTQLRSVLSLSLSLRLLGAAAALVLCAVAGCYNPSVNPGGLRCAPSGKACPDGFECGVGNVCLQGGSVNLDGGTGSGGATGTGGRAGTGGAVGTGGSVGQPLRKVGQTCLIKNEGQVDQSDDCESGLLCMGDCQNARCYKICESDADCEQSACTRTAPAGAPFLCEVPFVACNPTDTTAANCPGLGCYLLGSEASPTGGDRTVCDCTMGAQGSGEPCSDSRSCFKGLVCPPPGSGPGAGYCRRVCDPATGCPSGGTCQPFGATWGYCF